MGNLKIIINFPTNIGDTIMSLPVLDQLKTNYPAAEITAIASPQTINFLSRNNFINNVILFDKFWRANKKIKFTLRLRNKYALIVDLKNSFLPVIIGARRRTPFRRPYKNIHAKDTYLSLIKKIAPSPGNIKSAFTLSPEEKAKWDVAGIPRGALFVAGSSRSRLKRYPYDYLKTVVEQLKNAYPVVILGEETDRLFYRDILSLTGIIDLTGKTSLAEAFYLLEKFARRLLCVDSSILHLGSYLNIPLVTVFGPTAVKRYGPWSTQAIVLKEELNCSPCQKAVCKLNYECMNISPEKIIDAVKKLY